MLASMPGWPTPMVCPREQLLLTSLASLLVNPPTAVTGQVGIMLQIMQRATAKGHVSRPACLRTDCVFWLQTPF